MFTDQSMLTLSHTTRVFTHAHECTQIKADAADDAIGNTREEFPQYIWSFLIQSSGLKSLARKQLISMMHAVKQP